MKKHKTERNHKEQKTKTFISLLILTAAHPVAGGTVLCLEVIKSVSCFWSYLWSVWDFFFFSFCFLLGLLLFFFLSSKACKGNEVLRHKGTQTGSFCAVLFLEHEWGCRANKITAKKGERRNLFFFGMFVCWDPSLDLGALKGYCCCFWKMILSWSEMNTIWNGHT